MSNLQAALETIGGLTRTSKMPWYSFNLPATACPVGSQLNKVRGTVCSNCYALKGRYLFGNTKNALDRRLEKLRNTEPDKWVSAFVTALTLKFTNQRGTRKENRFRWHDSGDIQSREHLEMICEIARRTPFIRHWLPTKEYKLVSDFPKDRVPENLVIRVSHPKVGQGFKSGHFSGYQTSTVGYSGPEVHQCVAPSQGGECRSCDTCWRTDSIVNYKEH